MLNILVFYGGKSVEHDISIITGLQVLENINTKKYNVIPVYITGAGNFIVPDNAKDVTIYRQSIKKFKTITFLLGEGKVIIKRKFSKILNISCAINCCHGMNGEDGTLAGLLELSAIPNTSCDVLSSAICMDKIIMKDIFKANGLPCVDYIWFTRSDYEDNAQNILNNAISELDFPMVVKPSNLGSSIGISICKNETELQDAINVALMYDERIIVEKCVPNLREINCSCLGDIDCELSCLEEPKGWEKFLDFNEKYITGKKQPNKRKINPNISAELENEIFELSKQCFKKFCCSGVVRIDYLLNNETNELFVNELNTIPGSMAFYLWKDKNVEFSALIDKLIRIGINKYKRKNLNNYAYKSDVLKNFKTKYINKYSK